MKTQEKINHWNENIKLDFIRKTFSPRIQSKLLTIKPPKLSEEIKSSYIFGKQGTGKTILACFMAISDALFAYLNHFGGYHVLFVNVPNLLLELKSTFQRNSEFTETDIIKKYSDVDLLILDDFGIEQTTEWAFQMLYIIVNNRYENEKKTIITGNLSLEQLSEKMQDDRIPSRFSEMCEVIELTGKDFRTKV